MKRLTNLAEAWEEYSKACYLNANISEAQYDETQQAFYAGALCALARLGDIANLPDDQAAKQLQVLTREAIAFCQTRAGTNRT